MVDSAVGKKGSANVGRQTENAFPFLQNGGAKKNVLFCRRRRRFHRSRPCKSGADGGESGRAEYSGATLLALTESSGSSGGRH